MKLPAYPRYKPSGVKWLGDVPEHWETKKFTHGFSRIGSGTTPRSDSDDFYDGDVPWVTTSELREAIITKTKESVTQSALASHSALRIYPAGTLLFAMYGATIGRLGILGIQATVNQACCAFTEPTLFDTRFVFYWLWMRRPILISLSTGGGQPNLSQDDLRQVRISTPPLAEQRAIAAFLDRETGRVDRLVAKKRELIERLKEKRTALISRTVIRGLPPEAAAKAGLPINPPIKSSGIDWLGDIPKHWEVQKFSRCAFFQEGPGLRNWQFTQEGIRVICVTNITEAGISFSNYEKFISKDEYQGTYRHFTVAKGDLLLSSSGNSWGKVATFDADDVAILNTSTIRVNENSNRTVIRPLIGWLLISEGTREQLGLFMTGSCQPNFGPSHLARVWICVPPIPEQVTIAAYLDKETLKLDALIKKVEEAVERLQEYRTALITAAVTGKIDVRTTNQP